MDSPESLEKAKQQILARVFEDFGQVSRAGGVSWTESVALDGYEPPEKCLEARLVDKDKSWTELVDDENWNEAPGVGGFSFLDPIGFRYYLPAAMVRAIRTGYGESIDFHLALREGRLHDYTLGQWSLLNSRQRNCVAVFLQYMIACSPEFEDRLAWQKALDSFWFKYAEAGESLP